MARGHIMSAEQRATEAVTVAFGDSYTPLPPGGPVERALRAELQDLNNSGTLFSATLEASALALARSLDDGPENTTAAVSKELRATLEKLTEGAKDDRGPDLSGLSSPVHGRGRPDVPPSVGDAAPF